LLQRRRSSSGLSSDPPVERRQDQDANGQSREISNAEPAWIGPVDVEEMIEGVEEELKSDHDTRPPPQSRALGGNER
jgi:hypothetical protein